MEFKDVMGEALVKSGAEKFELEDIDGDENPPIVYIMPNDDIVLFDFQNSGDSASVVVYGVGRPRTITDLVTRIDLLWSTDSEAPKTGPFESWMNCPLHVALVRRLLRIGPDELFKAFIENIVASQK